MKPLLGNLAIVYCNSINTTKAKQQLRCACHLCEAYYVAAARKDASPSALQLRRMCWFPQHLPNLWRAHTCPAVVVGLWEARWLLRDASCNIIKMIQPLNAIIAGSGLQCTYWRLDTIERSITWHKTWPWNASVAKLLSSESLSQRSTYAEARGTFWHLHPSSSHTWKWRYNCTLPVVCALLSCAPTWLGSASAGWHRGLPWSRWSPT